MAGIITFFVGKAARKITKGNGGEEESLDYVLLDLKHRVRVGSIPQNGKGREPEELAGRYCWCSEAERVRFTFKLPRPPKDEWINAYGGNTFCRYEVLNEEEEGRFKGELESLKDRNREK